jgi:hypothetical protein
MDALRRTANDPAASPTEREFAERKLREYASQPVVIEEDLKGKDWRDRMEARTARIIAEERAARHRIALETEEREHAHFEAQRLREERMEKSRVGHATYMVNAQDELEEAQCRFEERRALRSERLAKARAAS